MKVDVVTAFDLDSVLPSLATVSDRLESDSQAEFTVASPLKRAHIASLLLNCFLWTLLLFFVLIVIWTRLHFPNKPFDNNLIIFAVCWGIIYLFYIIEAFTSSTFRMLVSKKRVSKVAAYLQRLRETEPEIKFIGQSFHYRGENTNASKKTNKRRIRLFGNRRILTTTSVKTFDFESWEDASDYLPDTIEDFEFIKINLKSEVLFADNQTGDRYNSELASFNQTNEGSDLHYEAKEVRRVPGVVTTIWATQDDSAGCLYSAFTFAVLTIFFLASWPYRALIQRRFGRAYLTVRKVVKSGSKAR